MGNSQGKGRKYRTPSMEAFDNLPKPLRLALANAVEDWSPNWFRIRLQKGASLSYLISVIELSDKQKTELWIEKREAENLLAQWGI